LPNKYFESDETLRWVRNHTTRGRKSVCDLKYLLDYPGDELASGSEREGPFESCRTFTLAFPCEGRVVDHILSNRRKFSKMTKSKKALIAGAALAGLLAGTTTTIQASNLLSGMHSAAQSDQSDNQVKEKHACKGQNSCKGKGGCKASDNGCKGKNSCKGKGGCATDGSKKPE
jgi:hypothetical protein